MKTLIPHSPDVCAGHQLPPRSQCFHLTAGSRSLTKRAHVHPFWLAPSRGAKPLRKMHAIPAMRC